MQLRTFGLFFVLSSLLFNTSYGQKRPVFESEGRDYFQDQIESILTDYGRLKNAFAEENPDEIREEARALANYLEEIQLNKLDKQARAYWIDSDKALRRLLGTIAKSSSLEANRNRFREISDILLDTIHKYGPIDLVVYKQYCPKAFDGRGAAWISDTRQINNPYEGGVHCGTVKERLGGD